MFGVSKNFLGNNIILETLAEALIVTSTLAELRGRLISLSGSLELGVRPNLILEALDVERLDTIARHLGGVHALALSGCSLEQSHDKEDDAKNDSDSNVHSELVDTNHDLRGLQVLPEDVGRLGRVEHLKNLLVAGDGVVVGILSSVLILLAVVFHSSFLRLLSSESHEGANGRLKTIRVILGQLVELSVAIRDLLELGIGANQLSTLLEKLDDRAVLKGKTNSGNLNLRGRGKTYVGGLLVGNGSL